jgi:hypothetical protein
LRVREDRAVTTRRPRRWDQIVLALGAISATVSILFAGWFIVWFQLFGDQPDRGDYAVASGLYAGGLLWLGIASLVAWLAGAPRWLSSWCWGATGLFAILWLSASQSARNPETQPASIGTDTFANGLQSALLFMPWSWLVIVALVLALRRRAHHPGVVTEN